jgi:hypothetical protein
MSVSVPEPEAAADREVVEYHFPVVVEIRESPTVDDRDITEHVMRKLLAELGR